MAEEKTPKSESQKSPYVTPKILTLKVDLSFASSATNLEDIVDLLDTASGTKQGATGQGQGPPESVDRRLRHTLDTEQCCEIKELALKFAIRPLLHRSMQGLGRILDLGLVQWFSNTLVDVAESGNWRLIMLLPAI